jgi:hypothetical protein
MNRLTARSDRSRLPKKGRTAVAACTLLFALTGTATAAPPTVTTLPIDPTAVTDTYALLSGIVNPNGIATVYKFQYGETTAYGSETPQTSAANGKADVPVDVAVDELKPATTYHFRLVAFPDPAAGPYYGVDQTAGADQAFTTSAALKLAFASKKAAVAKGKASVILTAAGPADEVAKGKLTLKAKIHKKLKKIGSARYSVTVGKTKTIKVRLTKAAKKRLKHGKLKASASAKTTGITAPATAKLKLKLAG